MNCVVKASYSPAGRGNLSALLLRASCKKCLALWLPSGHRYRISLLGVHEDNAAYIPAIKRNT
jgi:hypothetical protein